MTRTNHKQTGALAIAAGLLLLGVPAVAEPPEPSSFQLGETWAMGIVEHQLDDETEITGWRLNRSWYVGQQDGADDGFSLVWQGRRDQVSISSDGLRFPRRF